MDIRDFAEAWKREAFLLKEYIEQEIEEAAINRKTSLTFNYENYSTYAVLSCIVGLFEKGYKVIDTDNKTMCIRW